MKKCFMIPIVCVALAALCILVGGCSSTDKTIDACQTAEELYNAYVIATDAGMLEVSKEQVAQARLAAFILGQRCGWKLGAEDFNGVPRVTSPQ